MSRKWNIKLWNTRKNSRLTGIWKIWSCTHIRDWIYRSCIVSHKSLVLDGSLHYVQCAPYAEIPQIFLLLSMIWTVEFNRLPCPNKEMYGDAGFAIPFRYQLTIFAMRVMIWLSRLLHAHIAYEIDTYKIIATFFRIFYCLLDLIR